MACEVSENCLLNGSECWQCKFSIGSEGNVSNCYVAIKKEIKHPQAIAKRAQDKRNRNDAVKYQKANKDKGRQQILKNAAKVENSVYKTLNSGRINRDGDLTTKDLMIDVKSQSTRINAVIDKQEFDKAQNDAYRAGKLHGVLIIENSAGDRFVVMSEDLFREKFV